MPADEWCPDDGQSLVWHLAKDFSGRSNGSFIGCSFGLRPAKAIKHRNDRHEDSCSLVCEAAFEGGGNCTTYVGTHRAAVAS